MLEHFRSICNQDALEASEKNDRNGIAALVVKDGNIIGPGQNVGDEDLDISRHAEIFALAEATKAPGSKDLSGCTLYTSLQQVKCVSA